MDELIQKFTKKDNAELVEDALNRVYFPVYKFKIEKIAGMFEIRSNIPACSHEAVLNEVRSYARGYADCCRDYGIRKETENEA